MGSWIPIQNGVGNMHGYSEWGWEHGPYFTKISTLCPFQTGKQKLQNSVLPL